LEIFNPANAIKDLRVIVIEAVIKPFKLDDMKEALEELGVGGMTITELMQSAPPRTRAHSSGAGLTGPDMQPKLKIEVITSRQMAEQVIEAICAHGSSGRTEDGKIIIGLAEAAIRIRTGESDLDALS
jgi:nitrogen regulatory protein P-II 1